MKILFLCGSLEPGRDGVGDYTRRLAGELMRLGHSVSVIALKDREVKTVENTCQKMEEQNIPVIRIPYMFPNTHRYSIVNKHITCYDWDWISWQFVIYGYHKRGLPFDLPKQIKKIKSKARWNIMFHEIWTGIYREAPFRFRIYGILQKYIIRQILSIIKPNIITTQSAVYQQMLENLTTEKIYRLALFGNIPVIEYNRTEYKQNKSTVKIIVFGSIYPVENFMEFCDWITEEKSSTSKNIELYFVGKNGQELGKWIDIMEKHNIPFKILGEQNEETISHIMSESSAGLGTTPYPLIEKSGSVAAMLEHDLPVICLSKKWTPRKHILFDIEIPVVIWSNNLKINKIINMPPYRKNSLKNIASEFINLLKL
ncbi:MAG: hypothetical protein LBG92_03405 [Prevotellaceae bacterium]|jgi:hypothetical protein|nr:hypothetical protein [Prevotellaceae bacterium]